MKKYHVFHVGDSKILLIDDRVSQITKDEVSVVERDGKLKTLLANFMGKVEELWMNQSKRKPCSGERHFLWGPTDFFKRLREDILFDVIRRKNVQSDTEAEDVLKYLSGMSWRWGRRIIYQEFWSGLLRVPGMPYILDKAAGSRS